MLTSGTTTDIRRFNRDAELRVIRERGGASRTEIADLVGLTNAAVSRIIREVIEAGLVEEGEHVELKGQAGRRQVSLRMSEHGAYVLGVALTLNAREVVIGNGRGDIIDRVDCSDITFSDPRPTLSEYARRAKALIRRSSIDRRRLLGGAVSLAGRVDPKTGMIIGADPLGWDGQQVAQSFENMIGLPFISEGRAAALLQLEYNQGNASDLNDILLVNVGLRMGSALMIDGHLLRGATSKAMTLERFQLTSKTTLDDVASGHGILCHLEKMGRPVPAGRDRGSFLRHLVERDDDYDSKTQRAFRKAGDSLGRALRSLAPILSPQRVILAGLVVRRPIYLEAVNSKIRDLNLDVRISRFTTSQSAIHLALNRHLFNQRANIAHLIAA